MTTRERPVPAGSPGNAGDDLGPVLEFMKQLWALDHGLHTASKRMKTTYGITGPQRLVVRFVGRSPGISAGALAALLHIHPSTLTGILRRLEARGVVQRRHDPKDARRALLGLTARGRHVDALRIGTVEQAVRRVLARMPQDVMATERILAALTLELAVEESEALGADPDGS
jgi:MarR family transcriptional regulator, organic hydroperoxide resistance regulator